MTIAELLTDAFGRVHATVHQAVDGLTPGLADGKAVVDVTPVIRRSERPARIVSAYLTER